MIRNTAILFCRGVKIGYISDVHTEFMRKKETATQHVGSRKCDVMVLAGDIGNPFSHNGSYKAYLEACAKMAKHTLVLPGNHEYYQGHRFSMAQTKTKMSAICDAINRENGVRGLSRCCHDSPRECDRTEGAGDVRVVDDTTFTYPIPNSQQSIRFICSTLWSDIDTDHDLTIYKTMNDYSQIMGMTPQMSRRLYARSSLFINDSLSHPGKEGDDIIDIVVTHHAPSTHDVSAPEFAESPLTTAFASDFKYSRTARPPHAWIFGHTHHNVARYDSKLRTVLLSNQVGYKGEDCGMVCDWDIKADDVTRGNERGQCQTNQI